MASNLNTCCVSGNLTRDPELKITQSGMQVLRFGIACNESRKKPDGSWEDVPNFFDCVTFGNRAEALSRFLAKGMKVALIGRLKWQQWEKDGQKHSKIEIIADAIDIMARSQATGATQAAANQQHGQVYAQPAYNAPQPAYSAPQPPATVEYDDSIPF